ncbi:MAG: energy transducer TonB [Muribaculaceae bacterium]|nr:energy transducer TonB [Muribaculaceae bacterium]
MTNEVNLSSREWCDLVFEGKNKDFGAYVIRTDSPRRHMRAVIYTVIGFGLLIIGLIKVNEYMEQKRIADVTDQEVVFIDMTPAVEEPEPEKARLDQEKPEVLPEEVLNTIKVTEAAIVEDDQVSKEDEIKSQEEQMESDHSAGSVDFDKGTDKKDVMREWKDEIVVEEKTEAPKVVKEVIFRSVEQMPQFPGGDIALMKYLSSHIQYPAMAAENNVQGKVILQFVIEKDGRVGEVKLARSVDKDLDKEAIRVVKSLPKFSPGRQNGQPVRVWYTLPVSFRLLGTN